MYQRGIKNAADTKSGQVAETAQKSEWLYFTMMSLNTVIIPRPTQSNLPAVDGSVSVNIPSSKEENILTNVSVSAIRNYDLNESVTDEHQQKRKEGTKRKANFQEEFLDLVKNKIQIMEERLEKKSQTEDEGYMFLMNLLLSIKKLDDIQRLELRM
jgi:hypothetical protein